MDNERKAGHEEEGEHQPFLDSVFPNRQIVMGCLEQFELAYTEEEEHKLEWGTDVK